MVNCTLLSGVLLLERSECRVVGVDRSAIGECTLLILVILTSLVEALCNVLGLVQTSNFSCAECNANELKQRTLLINIRFGT